MQSVQLELCFGPKPVSRMIEELIEETPKAIRIYREFTSGDVTIYFCYVLTKDHIFDVCVSETEHRNEIFAKYDARKYAGEYGKRTLERIFNVGKLMK